jgi:hypothetical protein
MQARQSPEQGTLVLTPVSPALAQLLHQVQEQIIREADKARAPADADPVLSPIPSDCRVRFTSIGNDQALEVHSRDYFDGENAGAPTYSCTLYRDHFVEEMNRDWLSPHYWRGSENRRDQHGQVWTRTLGLLVTDDFGNLVRVAKQ